MDRSASSPLRHRAKLEGGPSDGRRVAVRVGSSLLPPDFILADEDGVYALAGAASHEGYLPYRWMSWGRAAALRHVLGPDSTVREGE